MRIQCMHLDLENMCYMIFIYSRIKNLFPITCQMPYFHLSTEGKAVAQRPP